MAKFFEISEENQQIFDDVWQESGMFNYIDLKVVGTPKAKEVINQFTNSLQKVDKVGTNNIAKEFEKANSSIKLINANLRKTDKLVIGITKTVKDLSTAR